MVEPSEVDEPDYIRSDEPAIWMSLVSHIIPSIDYVL